MSTKEEQLITHLSKEIAIHSNQLMIFRSRIVFVVLAGPFIYMGSFLISPQVFSPAGSWLAIGLASSWYMSFGYFCYRGDKGILEQCNKWRDLIICLSEGKDINSLNEEDFRHEPRSMRAYLGGFAITLATFICIIYLVM